MEDKKKLSVTLPPEVAEGTYANMSCISHSPSEFVLDFIRTVPGVAPVVKSRVIMTPEHTKQLLDALKDNINKYEASFGPIDNHQQGGALPFGFVGKGDA